MLRCYSPPVLGEAQFYQTHKEAAEQSHPWAGVVGTELSPVCSAGREG